MCLPEIVSEVRLDCKTAIYGKWRKKKKRSVDVYCQKEERA